MEQDPRDASSARQPRPDLLFSPPMERSRSQRPARLDDRSRTMPPACTCYSSAGSIKAATHRNVAAWSLPSPRMIALFRIVAPMCMAIGTSSGNLCSWTRFAAALKALETVGKGVSDEGQRLAARIAIRVLAGDLTGCRPKPIHARQLLEARLQDHPGEIRSLRGLSWVYLALAQRRTRSNLPGRRSICCHLKKMRWQAVRI